MQESIAVSMQNRVPCPCTNHQLARSTSPRQLAGKTGGGDNETERNIAVPTSVLVAPPVREHDLAPVLPILCGECPNDGPVRDATWQIECPSERREFVCAAHLDAGLRYALGVPGFLPPVVSPLPPAPVRRPLPGAVCAMCDHPQPDTCPAENGRCVRSAA